MANIVIDIASEFTGAKAFKKADSATDKLTKNVKKLAATVGLAYSTTQILAFAKSSVKAAAADQKAQQQLALALKNVGLGRDAATSEAYIQSLQSEFGIVDDLLRPAYQTLAVATISSAEAQRLLNLSLDISASTGRDLTSVTAALSRAFLGNNTALSKLGVGISKADLKAKSFDEITKQLTTTFAGSATAAANTFQGSMDKLGVASANVSEIIGTSLIDALKGLGDQDSVDNLANSMERAAERTGDVIRGIGVLIGKLKQLPGMPDFSVLFDISYLRLLEKIGASSRAGVGGGFPQGPPSDLTRQFPSAQTKLDKTAKETLKINKESLKLSKARAVFDLQKIQIEAALKGKISEEDAIRLKLMKAIEEENLTNIEKYQKALEVAQAKSKELANALVAVQAIQVGNPFSQWPDYVRTAIELTNTVAQASLKAGLEAGNLLAQALSGARYAGQAAAAADAAANKSAIEAINTGTAEQKAATEAQFKAQQDALIAASAAQLRALRDKLAGELEAFQELSDATAAAAEAAILTGAPQGVSGNLAKIAGQAAAQEMAAAAALASAQSAMADDSTTTQPVTQIEITVNTGVGDPNAIAEAIAEVLREASQRGTLELAGFE